MTINKKNLNILESNILKINKDVSLIKHLAVDYSLPLSDKIKIPIIILDNKEIVKI